MSKQNNHDKTGQTPLMAPGTSMHKTSCQKTSNQRIVEFLENEKGLKISAEIKTDIVLEIVKKISKTQNIKREKSNPDNKWAKWIYVKG